MYPPPPEIETTLFAQLPDSLHHRGKATEWARATRPHMRLHSFLEGPAFDRQGRLYCTDIPHGRIFRVSSEGEWSVACAYDGEPNGLRIHRDGRIFIADHRRGIMVLDPDSGVVEPFCTDISLERFRGCNDLFFASNGDLYVTDPGRSSLSDPTGRLFVIRHGTCAAQQLLGNIPYPNGVTLNLEETHLLVAATRANAIWRLLASPDPRRQMAGLFIQLSGGLAGPDGLALDEAGNLAVAHAQHGSVWLFDPYGEPLLRVRALAGRAITNLAYGGEDRRTLYILEAETGSILTARMPVPGRTLYSHL
jgi:gluconolactonase